MSSFFEIFHRLFRCILYSMGNNSYIIVYLLITVFLIVLCICQMMKKIDERSLFPYNVANYYNEIKAPGASVEKSQYYQTTSSLEKAFSVALDIRKFEIELYWKRATYFWLFMAACFTGASLSWNGESGMGISYLLSCLGLLIAFAFWMLNRGSKFWQENWEAHVDLLSEKICGPIYRYVIFSSDINKMNPVSAWPFSVSKINMYISFSLIIFWFAIIAFQFFIVYDMQCIVTKLPAHFMYSAPSSTRTLNPLIMWMILWGTLILLLLMLRCTVNSEMRDMTNRCSFISYIKMVGSSVKGEKKLGESAYFIDGRSMYIRKEWWENDDAATESNDEIDRKDKVD